MHPLTHKDHAPRSHDGQHTTCSHSAHFTLIFPARDGSSGQRHRLRKAVGWDALRLRASSTQHRATLIVVKNPMNPPL